MTNTIKKGLRNHALIRNLPFLDSESNPKAEKRSEPKIPTLGSRLSTIDRQFRPSDFEFRI